MIAYYAFPDIESADACSQQLYRLGRPYKHFKNDVGVRLFESIEGPNGEGFLKLNLDEMVLIHKDGVNLADPLGSGTVGVLLKNFAGQPASEELAGWLAIAQGIAQLPDRGHPLLEGQEPVIRVRLGDMMPQSALANLLDQEDVDALFPQPETPE